MTKINSAVNKIESISSKLEDMLIDGQIKKYLDNPGGTFCWREIAGTNRLSGYSFGMTIRNLIIGYGIIKKNIIWLVVRWM